MNLPKSILITIAIFSTLFFSCSSNPAETKLKQEKKDSIVKAKLLSAPIDTADYTLRMIALANGDTTGLWPAKGPFPLPGAILPYHRLVAFYGNLYSKKMGILGELPRDEMLAKLKGEVSAWQKADTTIPVMPVLHYIAVTAQGSGDKKRMRMPFHQIDTILNWAKEINGLVFIDVQVGWSTLQDEIPQLEKYLSMPNVHLGIDPEFSMKTGAVPGKKIGTYDAADINYVIDYLTNLVKTKNIPPKILVVHRFTQGMVTHVSERKKNPEVQIVMDMDGWGDKILKRSTWLRYIKKEPVQFTGFKLFYKNDIKSDPNGLYHPEELMKFTPKPIYIQYQ